MSKRASYVALAVGLAGLLLVALWAVLDTHSAKAKTQQATRSSLIIGTTDDALSLDPAETYSFHDWEILYNAGSGLLTYIPGTTELAPGLAITMPEVSPDGLMYTFTLRSGLQFPDGTAFNANAVKWSIDRVVALGGSPSWMVTGFVSEVQVVDSTTVRFVLDQAFAFFPQLVAATPYYPVSPNCFPADRFDSNSTCGGIGPYTIVTWTQGISTELRANPGYYGPRPRAPSIIVRYFGSAGDMRQALENGEIDVAWKTLTPAGYQELRANPNFNVVEGGGSYIRYLCFNTTTPPFDDASIRTALAAAVDREPTAYEVFSDTMSALYSMVPDGMWSHRDAFLDLYGQRNLTQTRTLLRQAGYSETNKLAMEFWYPLDHYGPLEPDFAAALAADIEESGMVSVTLQSADWSTYRSNLGAGTMPVFLLGWYPDYLDPDNYTWYLAHSSSSGDVGVFYDNAEMDSLLEAGRTTTPAQGTAREEIYEDIQELWAEEAPTIPLLQGTLIAVTQDGIRDVLISPLELLPYFTMWRQPKVYLPLVVRSYS
jgi:peptide/nickel transport system substrate-binding protein